MKKLILTTAIVLGSFTAMNAQTQDENTAPATEQTAPAQEAAPAQESQEAVVAQEVGAYNEIKIEEVPPAVTDALKKAFPDAVLNKASVNDKKEYQLEVKVGDKEGALYADENGKWIQK